MSELSDAIKDFEEEEFIEAQLKHAEMIDAVDEESLEIAKEHGQYVEPKLNKQEDQLLEDMKKLVGMDEQIEILCIEQDEIDEEVNAFAKEKGLDEKSDKITGKIRDLRKQYDLLHKDIGKRAEENYKDTKNVDPCLGVKVTMRKKRELIVDREAAVRWAVEKEHLTLLDIFDDSYADLIETGVFADQPGEVDTSPIPKARISLKPFQKEEE